MASANIKLSTFLKIVILRPISLSSRGKVVTPTIVRVVIKAATDMTEAPLSKREAARGKDIRAGINKTEPSTGSNQHSPDLLGHQQYWK